MIDLPDSIRPKPAGVIHRLVSDLQNIAGVRAVVLGGSHADGTSNEASDIDLGLYYFDALPIDISALGKLVKAYDQNASPTDLYEWGPWVNGGAWMTIEGQRIDLIYRSIDQLDRVIEESLNGQLSHHYWQQPAFGYHSQMMLADLDCSITLFDPDDLLKPRQGKIRPYPQAFQRAVIDGAMSAADLCLYQFQKAVTRNDTYNILGCSARFAYLITLTLFALNKHWYRQDKGAWDHIASFENAPDGVMAHLNDLSSGNAAAYAAADSLFSDLCTFCSYTSRLGQLRDTSE